MPVQPVFAFGDDPYSQPYSTPDAPDGMRWGEQPSHHGGRYVYPGRAVLVADYITWPYRPERCTYVGPFCLGFHELVLCPGCGLDVT